jgi:hypothetical protein
MAAAPNLSNDVRFLESVLRLRGNNFDQMLAGLKLERQRRAAQALALANKENREANVGVVAGMDMILDALVNAETNYNKGTWAPG